MKNVELKQTKIGELTLDYRDHAVQALCIPLDPQGVNYDEMSKVLPIVKKLKAAKVPGYVLLEDAEYDILVKRVKNLRYQTATVEVFEMLDELTNAPEVQLDEVKYGNAI